MILFAFVLIFCVMGFQCGPIQAEDGEPQCTSRFGCEYQVLLRLGELENRIKQQETTIQELKTAAGQRQEAAFSAFLTEDMSGYGNYRTIVFDHVLTNIGEAYNGKSGIFTGKMPGTYVFFWTLTNKDRTFMDSELVVNNQEICRTFSDSGDHNDYTSASNMAVVDIKQGDQVWVRSGTWHNGQFGGVKRSSFSGWLLQSR